LCESNSVGEGTRIWAFAHVMEGARIGRDCNIGDHAFIESGAIIGDRVTVKNGAMIWNGVVIEDDAFIGPGVLFTNDKHPRSPRSEVAAERYHESEGWLTPTRVHRGSAIGAGAVILCGVELGAYSTVGAGAVVTRDVPSQRLVLGNPARVAGWVCQCGAALSDSMVCATCERIYRLVGDQLSESSRV
jgi:acetyltransferase-like isoleucine patch superfamily enzyme